MEKIIPHLKKYQNKDIISRGEGCYDNWEL